MSIPEKLTAGDSVTWEDVATTDNLGNAITSPAWTLTYYVRGEVHHGLTLVGVASGGGWQTTITAAQSATLPAGVFYWQAAAANGSQRITLGQGTITIEPNLAYTGLPAAFDGRSEAEQVLAAIDAEIKARATGGTAEEYTIGNRSLKKTPMRELVSLQSRYKTIVVRERQAQKIAQGLGNPRAMYVRF
jgi:hypothetical protein